MSTFKNNLDAMFAKIFPPAAEAAEDDHGGFNLGDLIVIVLDLVLLIYTGYRSWHFLSGWLRRIRSAPLRDQQVMYGLSRTPKHPPPTFAPEVVNKILEIRDHPPHLLGRTSGPFCVTCTGSKASRTARQGSLAPPGQYGSSKPNTSASLILRRVSLSRRNV